eukprot:1184920-Prorocentrum_minimum.AAC.2
MKIAETSKLRDVIEDSIESTNEEISKMNVRTHRHPIRTLPTQCPPHLIGYPVAIKKYLLKEREAAEKQFQHSVERRAHRSLRPPRELVHDVPYRELKKQTALLNSTTEKFKNKHGAVDEVIGKLKEVRHMLAKDLNDKVRPVATLLLQHNVTT